MTRNTKILLTVGIPAGALALMVILTAIRPEPPRTPAPERVPSVTTSPVVANSGALPVRGNGTVRPRAEVELAPQVAGQVAWVSPSLVSGGRFARGDVLVRLDSADFVNAVAQARAQVAQDSVGVLEAAEEARIAREEYEQFAARRGLSGEPSPLVLREPQLQAARANLARSQAQLANAELALSRTRLTAPFDGVVRVEGVDEGAFAPVGLGLAQIYASDAVEVLIPLTDRDAASLPGLFELRAENRSRTIPATVTAEFGGRRYNWSGYVDRAETALDEVSRTIDVVVRVENPFRPGTPEDGAAAGSGAPPLLVGQYVDVSIQGASGDFQVVPRRALRPGNEVWAVADSLVRIVPVEVLQQADEQVWVRGDFGDYREAITSGVSLATNGMKVRIER
jgi:RND family efflux transporter MFP subunit